MDVSSTSFVRTSAGGEDYSTSHHLDPAKSDWRIFASSHGLSSVGFPHLDADTPERGGKIKLVYFSRTRLAARSRPATTIIGLAYDEAQSLPLLTRQQKVNGSWAGNKLLVGGIRRAPCAYT